MVKNITSNISISFEKYKKQKPKKNQNIPDKKEILEKTQRNQTIANLSEAQPKVAQNSNSNPSKIEIQCDYNPRDLDMFKAILTQAQDNSLEIHKRKLHSIKPEIKYDSRAEKEFLHNHGQIAWYLDERTAAFKPVIKNAKIIAQELNSLSAYDQEDSWLSKLTEVVDLSLSINENNELTWLINEGSPTSDSVTRRLKRLINSYNNTFDVDSKEFNNYIEQYTTQKLMSFIPNKKIVRLKDKDDINPLSSDKIQKLIHDLKPTKAIDNIKLEERGLGIYKFQEQVTAPSQSTKTSLEDRKLAALYLFLKSGKIISVNKQESNTGFLLPSRAELKEYGFPC